MNTEAKIIAFEKTIEEYWDEFSTPSYDLIKKLYRHMISFNDDEFTESSSNDLLSCVLTYLECLVNFCSQTEITRKNVFAMKNFFFCISDIFTSIDMKNMFVKKTTQLIFDIILESWMKPWYGKDLLRVYNTIIHGSSRDVRQKILEKIGMIYLYKLIDLLSVYGDYEYQTIIVETVFRICNKNKLEELSSDIIPESEELSRALLDINIESFDEDIRTFLNLLNSKRPNLFSVVCKVITLGDIVFEESLQMKNYDGIWLDFDLKDHTISWSCDRNNLQKRKNDSSDSEAGSWEVITLFTSNVQKVKIDRFKDKNSRGLAVTLKLKGPCLSSREESQLIIDDARILKFVITDQDRMNYLVKNVFPTLFGKNYLSKLEDEKLSTDKKSYKPLNIKLSCHRRIVNNVSASNFSFGGSSHKRTLNSSKSDRQIASPVTKDQDVITVLSSDVLSEGKGECYKPSKTIHKTSAPLDNSSDKENTDKFTPDSIIILSGNSTREKGEKNKFHRLSKALNHTDGKKHVKKVSSSPITGEMREKISSSDLAVFGKSNRDEEEILLTEDSDVLSSNHKTTDRDYALRMEERTKISSSRHQSHSRSNIQPTSKRNILKLNSEDLFASQDDIVKKSLCSKKEPLKKLTSVQPPEPCQQVKKTQKIATKISSLMKRQKVRKGQLCEPDVINLDSEEDNEGIDQSVVRFSQAKVQGSVFHQKIREKISILSQDMNKNMGRNFQEANIVQKQTCFSPGSIMTEDLSEKPHEELPRTAFDHESSREKTSKKLSSLRASESDSDYPLPNQKLSSQIKGQHERKYRKISYFPELDTIVVDSGDDRENVKTPDRIEEENAACEELQNSPETAHISRNEIINSSNLDKNLNPPGHQKSQEKPLHPPTILTEGAVMTEDLSEEIRVRNDMNLDSVFDTACEELSQTIFNKQKSRKNHKDIVVDSDEDTPDNLEIPATQTEQLKSPSNCVNEVPLVLENHPEAVVVQNCQPNGQDDDQGLIKMSDSPQDMHCPDHKSSEDAILDQCALETNSSDVGIEGEIQSKGTDIEYRKVPDTKIAKIDQEKALEVKSPQNIISETLSEGAKNNVSSHLNDENTNQSSIDYNKKKQTNSEISELNRGNQCGTIKMSSSSNQQEHESKIIATKKLKSKIKGVRNEKQEKAKSQSEENKRKPYFKIKLRDPRSKCVKQDTKEKDDFHFTSSEEFPLAQLLENVKEKPAAENKRHDKNDAASPKSETTLDFIRRALATDISEISQEPRTLIEEEAMLPDNSQKKKRKLSMTGELELLESPQVIENLKDIKLLSPLSDREPIFSTGELLKTLESSQRVETIKITKKFELTEELNMISEEIAFMNRFSGTLKSPVVARSYISDDDVDENVDKLMPKSVAIVGLPKEKRKKVENANKPQCGNENIEKLSDVSKETNTSDEKIGVDSKNEIPKQEKTLVIVLERLNLDTLNLLNESKESMLENSINPVSENQANSADSPLISHALENDSKKIKLVEQGFNVEVSNEVDNEDPFAASQSDCADKDGRISKSQKHGSQDSRKGTKKSASRSDHCADEDGRIPKSQKNGIQDLRKETEKSASQSGRCADEDGRISRLQKNCSQVLRKETEKSDLSQKSGHSSDMYSSQKSKDIFEHSPKRRNLRSKIPRLKGKLGNRMSAVKETGFSVDKRTVEIHTCDEKTDHKRKIVAEESSGKEHPSSLSELSSHTEQNISEINNKETVLESQSQKIEKDSHRIMDDKVQGNHEVLKVTDHISQTNVIEKETVQPSRPESIDDGMKERETNHLVSPVASAEVEKDAKKLENDKLLNKNNDDHKLSDKSNTFDPRLCTRKVCDLQGEKKLNDPRDLSHNKIVPTDNYNVELGIDEDKIRYDTSKFLSKSVGKEKDDVTKTRSSGSRKKRPQVSNEKHENEKLEESASEERAIFEDSGSDSYKPPVKQQKKKGNKSKPTKNVSEKTKKETNRTGRGQKKICKKKTDSTLDDIESRGSFDDSSIDFENLHEFPFTFDELIESLQNEDPTVKNAGLIKTEQSQKKKKYKPLSVETVKTSARLKSVEKNVKSAHKKTDDIEENNENKKSREMTNENADTTKHVDSKKPEIKVISNVLLNKRKSCDYNSSPKKAKRIDSSVVDVSPDSRTISSISLDNASLVADDRSDASEALSRFDVSQFEKNAIRGFDLPETEIPIMSWIATGQQDEETSYLPEALRLMKEHFAFVALTERGPVEGVDENYLKAFWKIYDILEKYVD